jgi:hypothetical protein
MITTLPQVDIDQAVTLDLLKEIESRIKNGYRLKADFAILINFARQQLENT